MTPSADQPELSIPIVCVPASINNDVPASDISIGSDSALNSIVTDVDKIKDSADTAHRCFIVEVMGHDCGYLALMAGLTTGAEQVYLPEEGISLDGLQEDLHTLRTRFVEGSPSQPPDPQVNTPNSTTRPSSWHRSSPGRGAACSTSAR